MGKQIGFYAVGQDYTDLLVHASQLGLRAIPDTIPADSVAEAVDPVAFHLSGAEEQFYLLPAAVALGEAIYESMTAEPNLDRLNAAESPVIELSPCRQLENNVYNGRLYLGLASDDRFYSTVLSDFNKLARTIRRWEKTDRFGFFVGPQTADQSRSGAIRLMHHEIEVHVE